VTEKGAERNQSRLMLRGCTALRSNVRPTEAEAAWTSLCAAFPLSSSIRAMHPASGQHIETLLQIEDMSCLDKLMTGPATANSLSTAKLLDELTLCL
jgi:hypothetical protein